VNLVTFTFSSILKGGILHDRRVLFVETVCQNLVFPGHNINFSFSPGGVLLKSVWLPPLTPLTPSPMPSPSPPPGIPPDILPGPYVQNFKLVFLNHYSHGKHILNLKFTPLDTQFWNLDVTCMHRFDNYSKMFRFRS